MSNNHQLFGTKSVLSSIVPDYVAQQNPQFIKLLEAYMDYLETQNEATYYQVAIDILRDIDLVPDEHIGHLQSEVGSPVPRRFAADPKILYKTLTNLYRSRGTKHSIEDFFNILYNDEVEIYYPMDDLLIPSDGFWNDKRQDTIDNPENYSPLLTYTVAADTKTISGNDDSGYKLLFDNPIVYLNGTKVDNWTPRVETNTTTNTLDYYLDFDADIYTGDKVEIRRSGSFSSANGFLSNRKYIQDSFYYQKFSYVLRTGQNADEWKSAFTRLIHPSGFIFFGEILISLMNQNKLTPYLQPGRQIGGLAIPLILPVISAEATFVRTKNNRKASFNEVEWNPSLSALPLGPQNYFEQIKFHLSSPIGNFADYTVEDVINKTIDVNMDSVVELSN